MRPPMLLFAAVLLLTSCKKAAETIIEGATSAPSVTGFQKYTIRSGQQYCDQNGYKSVDLTEMKFSVRFDSTAIYTCKDAQNQDDINKLYGFSDNNSDHHQFSARFGWRWSNNALRLFAYVYNRGQVSSKEITTIPIGHELNCSILVAGKTYVFKVNDTTLEMPREAETTTARGYQLYPYFGGDEVAPHEIDIWIKG
jgi:hypothetical protein